MRQLIHVPIVHSQADLGPIQERVRQAYVAKGGEEAWKASRAAVAKFWTAIEKAMDGLRLDWRKVRLYQDGLPVCGLEERIVRDLAAQGGANYRILLKLLQHGAVIEGTEDPDLLRKEYELIMAGLSPRETESTEPAATSESEALVRDLLQRRDAFIARRIDATLRPDETGILFLGALHHAIEMLPDTVRVTSLSDFIRMGATNLTN